MDMKYECLAMFRQCEHSFGCLVVLLDLHPVQEEYFKLRT